MHYRIEEKRLFPIGCFILLLCAQSMCASNTNPCACNADCQNANCVMNTCLDGNATILAVCWMIKERLSPASQLFYPTDPGYDETIAHFFQSSTTPSFCSVEPGIVADVMMIMKLIGQYRVPFAVKGGGHIFNPGFSSTIGIHISMRRFQKLVYHPNKQTVDIGSGMIWDDVFEALDPYNVSVVGGRVSGIGVAGFTLGGGYSWQSNQYGLTIDNMVEYELVTPNGTVVNVNKNSYPDIFFGLKGGYNNFGIVTNFKIRTIPQTHIYAGVIFYTPPNFRAALYAMNNFHVNNNDPKASIFGYLGLIEGQLTFFVFCVYNAPIAPIGIFDEFLSIPHITNTLQTQPFFSFIQSTTIPPMPRARLTMVAINDIGIRFLDGVLDHMLHLNSTFGSRTDILIALLIQPFISTYFDNSQGGAYPHVPSTTPLFIFGIEYAWNSPSEDTFFLNQMESSRKTVLQLAVNDGQKVGGSKQILYPNYAPEYTPLSRLYGNNVPKLRKIRKDWDPDNVMYLTGGFKF